MERLYIYPKADNFAIAGNNLLASSTNLATVGKPINNPFNIVIAVLAVYVGWVEERSRSVPEA
ncbi:hypothetical protein NIES4074_15760 [Cylindrospermum sp. NIES-4074]|nr:hypothetical protein NIES4074_15760 [Cylindrospermum sp. NIES-4074]